MMEYEDSVKSYKFGDDKATDQDYIGQQKCGHATVEKSKKHTTKDEEISNPTRI